LPTHQGCRTGRALRADVQPPRHRFAAKSQFDPRAIADYDQAVKLTAASVAFLQPRQAKYDKGDYAAAGRDYDSARKLVRRRPARTIA